MIIFEKDRDNEREAFFLSSSQPKESGEEWYISPVSPLFLIGYDSQLIERNTTIVESMHTADEDKT